MGLLDEILKAAVHFSLVSITIVRGNLCKSPQYNEVTVVYQNVLCCGMLIMCF